MSFLKTIFSVFFQLENRLFALLLFKPKSSIARSDSIRKSNRRFLFSLIIKIIVFLKHFLNLLIACL